MLSKDPYRVDSKRKGKSNFVTRLVYFWIGEDILKQKFGRK